MLVIPQQDGSKIFVRFDYAVRDKSGFAIGKKALQHVGKKKIFTFCNISIKKDGVRQDLAGDYSIAVPEDRFVKRVGRFLAVRYAMQQIRDRNLRTEIWKALQKHFDMSATQEQS